MSFQIVSIFFVTEVPVLDLVMADEKILFLLPISKLSKNTKLTDL